MRLKPLGTPWSTRRRGDHRRDSGCGDHLRILVAHPPPPTFWANSTQEMKLSRRPLSTCNTRTDRRRPVQLLVTCQVSEFSVPQ
jgi:hypothetical protein